ncbi:hypothetical protein DRN76_03020 [Methanosarcinales archaeon]|nr:MAG: hypothetical protein DRN76_03020 [Methanosarcinales archaeon]
MFTDPRESVYHKIISLDENSPSYYTTLFKLARLILPEKNLAEMDEMIGVIEQVLGGSIMGVLVTIANFNDARAFFKHTVKDKNGITREVHITRFEVMSKLEEIRMYIFESLKEIQKTIRFSKVPVAV